MGDIILFPSGKRVAEGTKLSEEELGVSTLIHQLRDVVVEGDVRKIFVTLLAPDNRPVYIWCNLDHTSLRMIGNAMETKAKEIDEFLKRDPIPTELGVDYGRFDQRGK